MEPHCINCGSLDVKFLEPHRPQNTFCSKGCQRAYYYPEGKETPRERYLRKRWMLEAGVPWRRVFEVYNRSGWEEGTCPPWIDARDEDLWIEYWDEVERSAGSPPSVRKQKKEMKTTTMESEQRRLKK